MWSALKDGADFNPPLLYFVTHSLFRLAGDSAIVSRLPAMVGFYVMCFCLYRVVSNRCGPVYGLAAMVFPLLSPAYYYAAEARPYGLVLGFSGLALLSWQELAEGRRRWFFVPLFGISMLGAVQSHCYAVLLLIPFGVAEVIRAITRKRADALAVGCLVCAAASTLVYLPLLSAIGRYRRLPTYFFAPRLSSIAEGIQGLFGLGVWPVLLVFVFACATGGRRANRINTGKVAPHEIACYSLLALMPLWVFAVSLATNGSFMPRYAVPAVIGLSVLLCLLVHHSTAGDRATAGVMAHVFFISWLALSVPWPWTRAEAAPAYALPAASIADFRPDLPIVVSNALTFLESDHDLAKEAAARLVFLTDANFALAYTGTEVFDKAFYTLSKWFPIRGTVTDYETFLAAHRRFLVFGPYTYPEDWLIPRLLREQIKLTLRGQFRGRYGDYVLLEAELPEFSQGPAR